MAYKNILPTTNLSAVDIRDTIGLGNNNLARMCCAAKSGGAGGYAFRIKENGYQRTDGAIVNTSTEPYFNIRSIASPVEWFLASGNTASCRLKRYKGTPLTIDSDTINSNSYCFDAGAFAGYKHASAATYCSPRYSETVCSIGMTTFDYDVTINMSEINWEDVYKRSISSAASFRNRLFFKFECDRRDWANQDSGYFSYNTFCTGANVNCSWKGHRIYMNSGGTVNISFNLKMFLQDQTTPELYFNVMSIPLAPSPSSFAVGTPRVTYPVRFKKKTTVARLIAIDTDATEHIIIQEGSPGEGLSIFNVTDVIYGGVTSVKVQMPGQISIGVPGKPSAMRLDTDYGIECTSTSSGSESSWYWMKLKDASITGTEGSFKLSGRYPTRAEDPFAGDMDENIGLSLSLRVKIKN